METEIIWRERFWVAAIHFLVTLIVTGFAAVLIFLVWFPGVLANIVGGRQLFLLVVGSDLILGPLISLVIFNRQKSRRQLVLDYVIVGAVQLAALIYGVSIVADSRPVFVAFAVDRLEVVTAAELEDADLKAAADTKYKSRSWFGPVLVSVQFPTDPKERTQLLFSALNGADAQLLPKYYRAYDSQHDEIKIKSESLSVLVSNHKIEQNQLDKISEELHYDQQSLRWLPVHHRFGFSTAILDAATGYPLKYLPIDPY